ncbi:probable G-protein coupled receptor 82 isoform X2 [Esox lucius]|uniref:Si:dkey-216e24.9 n=1 Tax=Esox lucius TaxID=8010 RepID=A0AAY5K241_ESOLU|nr:probable G-protein coupled receptor 82 isoform X2 [Esox lucius]
MGHWIPGSHNSSPSSSRQCWLYPNLFYTQIKPWLYLTLMLLGSLGNSLTLRDLWRSEWTPTLILNFNTVTSDLLLCLSFLFRMMYYLNCQVWSGEDLVCKITVETMLTVFYINLYCNMLMLLWTSVTRYATVVRPHPAFLTPLTTTTGCWVLCLTTWVTVATVVCASLLHTIGEEEIQGGSCFDMLENGNRQGFNNPHCLGVVVFFIALALILVSYGGLVLHLQKVRGARHIHTRERRARVAITEGVRTVSADVKEGFGVNLEERKNRRVGSKVGSLKVRRKILATVVVFMVCFLPYHIQLAVTLLTPQGSDCDKVRTLWEVNNATIAIASLSCILNPLLYLALRRLSCCQGRQ